MGSLSLETIKSRTLLWNSSTWPHQTLFWKMSATYMINLWSCGECWLHLGCSYYFFSPSICLLQLIKCPRVVLKWSSSSVKNNAGVKLYHWLNASGLSNQSRCCSPPQKFYRHCSFWQSSHASPFLSPPLANIGSEGGMWKEGAGKSYFWLSTFYGMPVP